MPNIVDGQFSDVDHDIELCGEGDKIKILDDLSCESDFEADFENLYLDENAIFDEAVGVASSFQPKGKVLLNNANKIDLVSTCPRVSGTGCDGGYYKNVRKHRKEKANRATVMHVLDRRTLLIINKMMSQGLFDRVTGVISTGKEANVFRTEKFTDNGVKFYALKVYKTSILSFKQRAKYVKGDYRLRNAYQGTNPRKMVSMWAEKEYRNLNRAAPLLKNAFTSDDALRELYVDIILYMKYLYQNAKLIHADLSEFNILYHKGQAYIIDVSQAVEHNNFNAMVFLRNDCTNVTEFFRSRGLAAMSVRELFDFITDQSITDEKMDMALEAAMEKAVIRSYTGMLEQEKIDEEVFKNVFIPCNLDEVNLLAVEQEQEKKAIGVECEPLECLEGSECDQVLDMQETYQLDEDDVSMSDMEEMPVKTSRGRPKNETVEEKRERKMGIKEIRHEKLKSKIPKKEKKRKHKLNQCQK